MNIPQMSNEQFAIWFAASQGMDAKFFDRAQTILNWLEKNGKKPEKQTAPITPKGK